MAGLLGYYPLVLDGSNYTDSEGAQILQIVQMTGVEIVVVSALPRLLEPNPTRKGKMRLALRLANDPQSPVAAAIVALTVRSPIVNDTGSPVNAPILNCAALSIATNTLLPAAFTAPSTFVAQSTTAQQSLVPAYNFALTFNSKPIPNYTYILNFATLPAALSPILEIDFSHSVAS